MTDESVSRVEVTLWLSSCSVSDRDKSHCQSGMSGLGGCLCSCLSLPLEKQVGKRRGERRKREGGEKGNPPMPESCYSEAGISAVNRLSSLWR